MAVRFLVLWILLCRRCGGSRDCGANSTIIPPHRPHFDALPSPSPTSRAWQEDDTVVVEAPGGASGSQIQVYRKGTSGSGGKAAGPTVDQGANAVELTP